MILADYIYGFIEDNSGLFALPKFIAGLAGCTDFVGYPTGMCQNLWQSNQPFIFIPAFLLAKLINPALAYNLIVLGGLALNFVFALRFFKHLFGRFIGVLLGTTFVFSPYLAYQGRSHFDLIQVWPVIWFFHTLFFSQSRHKPVYLGLLLTLSVGISNYLGYFTGLAAALYLVFSFLTTKEKRATLKIALPHVAKASAVFILTSLVFTLPYIKSNYFAPKVRMEDATDPKALNRPFEDFVIFSSRPWYYVLPSVDNPFFGQVAQKSLDLLSSTNNYLAQNYFKAEHSASFLGWATIFLAFIGFIGCKVRGCGVFAMGTKPANTKDSEHTVIVKDHPILKTPHPLPRAQFPIALLLTILGLIILTMPPSIVLNGVEIYTPSYLLFKAFPMFRVLSRMGIVIMLYTLVFSGYGYKILSDFMLKKKVNLIATRSILALLALLSVAQLFVPPKITHVATPPKVYGHLGQTDPFKSPIVVYPYSKTNEALFWLTAHQKALINPRFYSNKETAFDSETFTELIKTTRGLEQARNLGAKYLVYFYKVDNGESADFFATTSFLQKLADFSQASDAERQIIVKPIDRIGLTFVRIVEAGSAKENSAILYRFR